MTKNKMFLLALILMVSTVVMAKKTKEVQVIFGLAPQPWYTYAANVGGFITYNPTDFTPFGTMYVLTALILPKNTIDYKHQVSYLTDRYGNPITQDSAIGVWRCLGTRLLDFDFFNLPASGTVTEIYTESFEFSNKNNVFAEGKAVENSDNILNKRYSAIVGGTGKNKDIFGTAKGTSYFAPDGQSLLVIYEFNESVEY